MFNTRSIATRRDIPRIGPHRPLPQNGFTLIELAVAVVIAGVMATAGLYYQAQELRYQVSRTQVDQLKVLNTAVAKYQGKYANELVAGTNIPLVASDKAPTVAELKALGLLDASFSAINLYSPVGGYATSIRTTPVGCSGSACSLFGLAYLATPLLDERGRVDNAALGEAIAYGGGNVGASTDLDKNIVQGNQGIWSVANPLPNVSGILAMRSDGDGGFLPLDGLQAMSGNLKMGANDITGVSNFSATGTVAGTNVQASNRVSGANVQASSLVSGANVSASNTVSGANVQATNLVSGANLQAANTVFGTNLQASSQVTAASVAASGLVSAANLNVTNKVTTGAVQINSVVTANSACPTAGLVARDGSGALLSCQYGAWQAGAPSAPSGLIGYFYAWACPANWRIADGGGGTPDLRGRFLRGIDAGTCRGEICNRGVGTYQPQSLQSHGHNVLGASGYDQYAHGLAESGSRGIAASYRTTYGGLSYRYTDGGGNVLIANSGGAETRPENIALLICMKL